MILAPNINFKTPQSKKNGYMLRYPARPSVEYFIHSQEINYLVFILDLSD